MNLHLKRFFKKLKQAVLTLNFKFNRHTFKPNFYEKTSSRIYWYAMAGAWRMW